MSSNTSKRSSKYCFIRESLYVSFDSQVLVQFILLACSVRKKNRSAHFVSECYFLKWGDQELVAWFQFISGKSFCQLLAVGALCRLSSIEVVATLPSVPAEGTLIRSDH